jgi:DNA-binding beta-propeller fold protein YncE
MTARLLLIFGVISLSLVFSGRQYSSAGPADAEECASDDTGIQSRMVRIESGEEVCVDEFKLGSEPDQKEQADSYKGKPLGGDIPAVRSIVDPHPAFVGVAVDPVNDIVVMADTNRKSVVSYDRRLGGSKSDETSEMRRQIIGPDTNIGFVAGVAVDPARRELYAVNNDIEDTMMVWSYEAEGNAKPLRLLAVPHQAWGLALSSKRDELAISIELQNAVVVYRREAVGLEAPVRYIRGAQTGMADPHGVYWDEQHNEIAVANHGNFRGLVKDAGLGCMQVAAGDVPAEGGRFQPPSLTFYSATASGDEKPLRTIEGERTRLDWPMGIDIDAAHDEVAVANNGDNSILIFRRTQSGDVVPQRVIRGSRTGINRPMGVSIDTKNNEIWVSNFGDHTALVFARDALGNVLPRRIIRSAPAGAPSTGFGNPMAVAYDSKREEILVPN